MKITMAVITYASLFIVFVCCANSASAAARRIKEEPYCLAEDANPYLKFASKTAYDVSRGTFAEEAIVPEGCEAVQAWHFVRHGIRYPGDGDIEDFVEDLPGLRAQIILASLSGEGELCAEDVTNLQNWGLGGINETWDSILAPAGEVELADIGFRYKQALPNLLGLPFSNETYTFRHTDSQRTEASAKAYAKSLFGEESIYIPKPLDPDPILKFYDACNKYIQEVEDNPDATIEADKFTEGPEMANVLLDVSRRVGFDVTFKNIDVMYDACRYYQAWNMSQPSAWCAVFTPENLKIMEYWQDLEYYYEDGYGFDINYECACPPIKDLFEYFRNIVEGGTGPKGVFYFTHSGALYKVMARLGLFKDSVKLAHDTYDPDRLWRTSNFGTFATNLAFTLSNCGEGGWWVSAMLREIPLQLPGCASEAGCTWDEFNEYYGPFSECDFDTICENSLNSQSQSS